MTISSLIWRCAVVGTLLAMVAGCTSDQDEDAPPPPPPTSQQGDAPSVIELSTADFTSTVTLTGEVRAVSSYFYEIPAGMEFVPAVSGAKSTEPLSPPAAGGGAATPDPSFEGASSVGASFSAMQVNDGDDSDAGQQSPAEQPPVEQSPSDKPPPGVEVKRGRKLGSLRVIPRVREDLAGRAESGTIAASELASLEALEREVLADADGRFVHTDAAWQVQSTSLAVVTPATPDLALRLGGRPALGSAEVPSRVGEVNRPCEAVSITSATALAVTCYLPDDVATVAGVPAVVKLTQSAGAGAGVTVPSTAIRRDESDRNFLVEVLRDGETESVPVVVGVSDGVRTRVIRGVQAGDQLAVKTP